jgi:hypothetical protein
VVELVELMLVLQEVTRLWWVHDGVTVPAVDVTTMLLNFTEVVLGSLLQPLAL